MLHIKYMTVPRYIAGGLVAVYVGTYKTPTIIGETGWTSGGVSSEELQANYIQLVSQYSFEKSLETNGEAPFGLIIHRYKDLDISKPHPFVCPFNLTEYTFGLLREDGSTKLGWYAYQRAIRVAGGSG